MDNDLISLFLNRKKRNIISYTNILSKYTLKGNVKVNKIIERIVDIYINDYYLEKNLDFSLLTEYFEIKQSKESTMKNILLSSIIFYKNSGLENQIKNDINTIVLLSNIIFLAVLIDDYTNELLHANEDEDIRISAFFSKYQTKIKLPEEEYNNMYNEISKEIHKDIIVERKFWKSLISNNYYLNFSKNYKYNNLYLVNYDYDIKLLNRYSKQEVKKVFMDKALIDDFNTIYLEQLSIFILKNLLYKHFDDYFFIKIYPDYFVKSRDIAAVDKILKNKSIKKHIIFLFDYNDINKNMSVIKDLYSKDYKLGVINISDGSKITNNSFDMFDFVYIKNSILDNYSNYLEVWRLKKINFIVGNEDFISIAKDKILNG